MARTLTAGTIAQSTRRLGSEPIVIVRVDWVGGTKYYGDKSFTLGTLNIEGRITDFGAVSSKINDRTYGAVDSANITICDIDGDLKTIFDSEIIEKRPVTVYHHFEGLAQSDLTTILVGKIMSPIKWSEGERTLTFDIGNDWDSEDLLLEIKETSVDFPSEEEIGTVFPLCFGSVLRLPGVRASRVPTGKLLTQIYSWTTWFRDIDDPTSFKFTFNKTQFQVSGFESYANQSLTLEIENCLFYGTFDSDGKTFNCATLLQFNAPWYGGIGIISRDPDDNDYTNPSVAWVAAVGAYTNLKGKYVWIRYSVRYNYLEYIDDNGQVIQDIIDNESYTTLKAGDDGSTVNVEKFVGREDFIAQITEVDRENNKIFFSQPCVCKTGDVLLGGAYGSTVGEGAQIVEARGEMRFDWVMLPTPNAPYRWDIGPGARVKVHDLTKPDLYVYNSVASEYIYEVSCKKGGVLYLLPEEYYTINLAHVLNVNGNMETLTTLTLNRDIETDGWDASNIYVSLRSTIHSNTATDVIDWIATNRTSLTPNAGNFTAVGALVEKYPSHFAYLTQRDALAAIQEIAWLARLGVFIDGEEIFLHYLALEPTSHVFEALTANIRFKSMEISKTSSDDIFTKFTSFWNFTYEETEKNKVKSENNVDLYGEHDFEIENVIYNIKSLVEKCHNFWLNRKSNCWYTIDIDTFLYSLNVQIWDAVLVNVSFINGGTPIRGHVISIGHDSVTHQIVLTVWLPLKHGVGEAYQDDSADVKPDDPALGLGTLSYSPVVRTVKRVNPGVISGRRARKDAASITDYQQHINKFLDTLEYTTYHAEVLELYGDCAKCRLIDSVGFTSVALQYAIKNNILAADNTIWVALPIGIREQTWKDKQYDNIRCYRYDKTTKITYYKDLSVLFSRMGSSVHIRWATPQSAPNYPAEYQLITPSYVVATKPTALVGDKPTFIEIQFCPKGTGLVTSEKKMIRWQEMSTREYATIADDEPQVDPL
jgi:hypothetical protein